MEEFVNNKANKSGFIGKEVFIVANFFYQGVLEDQDHEYYYLRKGATKVIRVSDASEEEIEAAVKAGKWQHGITLRMPWRIERSSVEGIGDFSELKEEMIKNAAAK